MPFRHYILPFTLGVAAGVLLTKNWPKILEVTRPLLRGAMKGSSGLIEKGREAYHQQSEKFSDLIAEIREEEDAKAKATSDPAAEPARGIPTEPKPA